MKLKGKTAIVTGGSRGIGRAVVELFAREGASVVITCLKSITEAESAAEAVRKAGGRAVALTVDVRDLDQVKRMAATALEQFGQIDILVNNAGILKDNYLTFMKEDEWDDVVDTDLKGPFFCTKVVGREMMRRKSGRIVNIASDAGLMGDLMRANYASAKSGLLGLTRTAARELAAHGILVNAVSPGLIATDMTAGMPDSRRAKQLEAIPQARFGRPDEVAAAVLFLASDDSGYITGETLCVDGGLHTR